MSTYSHGSISLDLYIEFIEWLNILNPKVNHNMHVWNFWSHSMTWSSRRIVWCNRLSELFLEKDYSHTNDCWRIFLKKSWIGFYITLICGVDDLIIKGYLNLCPSSLSCAHFSPFVNFLLTFPHDSKFLPSHFPHFCPWKSAQNQGKMSEWGKLSTTKELGAQME